MPLLFGNAGLTSKEWAITALVFQGCTNAQIAAETRITEDLVESHLRRIFEKTLLESHRNRFVVSEDRSAKRKAILRSA